MTRNTMQLQSIFQEILKQNKLHAELHYSQMHFNSAASMYQDG